MGEVESISSRRRSPHMLTINYSVDADVIPINKNTYDPNPQDRELARGNEEIEIEQGFPVSEKILKIAKFMSDLEQWKNQNGHKLSEDEALRRDFYRLERDLENLLQNQYAFSPKEAFEAINVANEVDLSLMQLKEERN
jgi:hypothetical protein